MFTDPIADMLTRIRNALKAKHTSVTIVPASRLKLDILNVLQREGFLHEFKSEQDKKGGKITVELKYTSDGVSVITNLRRISTPGRRVYVTSNNIPLVQNGLGVAVLSTSYGLLADYEAKKKKIGGELLLEVW